MYCMLPGLVYLSDKERRRSALAEVDMYCIQIGMNTIMEGKWILGSCDSGDFLSLIWNHGYGFMEKVLCNYML